VAALPTTTGVGRVLGGRYRLDAIAGRGGMATVYRAHDLRHHRAVAVKVLDAARLSAVDAARFEGEIDVLAQLQHPHVLPLLDSGSIDGARYLVTPYIAGESLARRLAREQRLPIDESVRLARQVAGALEHAHSIGVVHRDVTPGNILLSNGLAVVSDFGIARLAEPAAGVVTQTGITIGTPAYMSPEQASGDGALDARSDVYALGCVLYTMLTGAPPFAEFPVQQSLTKRMLQAPPPPSVARPDIPHGLDEVLMRALAPLPEDRYDGALAFDAALAAVEADLASASRPHTARGLLAASTMTTQPSARTRATHRRWWTIGGISAVAVAAAAIAMRGGSVDGAVAMNTVAIAGPATDSTAAALRAALGRWRDVAVREATDIPYSPSAERLAHAPGALRVGAVAWTQLVRDGEGRSAVQVDAARFDGDRVAVARGVVPLVALSLRDATRIALDSALGVTVPAGDRGAGSLVAQRAYAHGRRAMAQWELDTAVAALRRAVVADSGWAASQLALTQALVWLGDSTRAEARDAAEQLAAVWTRLPATSQAAGQAIVALGRGELPQACTQYSALVARDSGDASAWLGLALCQQRDSVVVPDLRSPSGMAFRSSWWSALTALRRALSLAPDAHHVYGFRWLTRRLLTINTAALRAGSARDGTPYGAFPSHAGDSVAFVPWSFEQIGTGSARVITPDVPIAFDENRQRLLEIATEARRARPGSADANENFALAMEGVGEIVLRDGDALAPIDSAVGSALAQSTSSDQQLRLGALLVRVALKRGRFSDARRLADSIATATVAAQSFPSLRTRSALFALVGRPTDAAALAERASVADLRTASSMPPGLRREGARLAAFAAFGMRDSTNAAYQRVIAELRRWIPPAQQDAWRDRNLAQPALLAADALNGVPDWAPSLQRLPIGMLLAAASRRDSAAVLRYSNTIDAQRALLRPGEFSLDAVLVEARALDRVGATDRALVLVDQALDALPARDVLLLDVATSASLVQLMQLRASFAPQAPLSIRWRAAADTLWSVVSRR
jgi:tetratricopeptide (TPR) repeat protein